MMQFGFGPVKNARNLPNAAWDFGWRRPNRIFCNSSRKYGTMAELDEFTRQGLECLRQAVAEALERKRKLGQYAVFWRDGRVVFEGPDAPEEKSGPEPSAAYEPELQVQ